MTNELRKPGQVRHAARMTATCNEHEMFEIKWYVKKPLERSRSRWEENVKIGHIALEWVG
jgi:hypothetical protein